MAEEPVNGNGAAPVEGSTPEQRAEFRAAMAELKVLETNVLLARLAFARQHGLTFNGDRDEYEVFGYDRQITAEQFRAEYARGGIAGRIVDTFPNATWRGTIDVVETDNPEKTTAFEQAFRDFDKRLQVQPKLLRVDKLAGLSTFAVLLIGSSINGDLSTELPRGKDQSQIIYLTPFAGGGGPGGDQRNRTLATGADAFVHEYEDDTASPRFGLPKTYQLKRLDIKAPTFQKPVHWSRVVHVAENLLDDDVFGQPRLERVWNLLVDLRKVTGGGAEAFWLRANQGLHVNVDKDMQLSKDEFKDVLTKLNEQSELYKHQLTRWIKTRGVDINTLGSDVANFNQPADAVMTQIAGALGIPKRILTGSEMGELASSQDRDNWKDQVNGRQTGYAGPYIVRPLVDRLIKYGYLPAPKKGPDAYEVKWPQIQVLTEDEKAKGAQAWAQTNATMGEPVFTEAEIRDKWYGMDPLSDEQREEIRERKLDNAKLQQEVMGMTTPPEPDEEEELRAAEDHELLPVLVAAIEQDNREVVDKLLDGVIRNAAFNTDQPRDEQGRWVDIGGGVSARKVEFDSEDEATRFWDRAGSRSSAPHRQIVKNELHYDMPSRGRFTVETHEREWKSSPAKESATKLRSKASQKYFRGVR